MITRERIQAILKAFIKELKKKNSNFKDHVEKGKELDLRGVHKTYDLVCEQARRIAVHSKYGTFPEMLFKKRSPNQTEQEFEYIKENYKQVSLPVYADFKNQIFRIFQDTNFSISYKEDDSKFGDQTLQRYLNEELKKYGSLENFMKNFIPDPKLCDPNGVVVSRPSSFDVQEGMDEDGNKTITATPSTEDDLLTPIPFYYTCRQVVDEKEGEWIMVLTDMQSKVKFGREIKKVGLVFEVYDRNTMWRVQQVGKFSDFQFEIFILWQHNLDIEPFKKLMGTPRFIGDKVVFESPFLPAVDLLDLVVLNSANLQAAINKSVYPYRIMLGDRCQFQHGEQECNDGLFFREDGTSYNCPKCNGTGLLSRISVMGEMLIQPPSRTEGDGEVYISDPIKYVSPDTDVLEYLENNIDRNTETARRILHLSTSETKAAGPTDTTATGQALDLKALYAYLTPISDQIFRIWEYLTEAMGKMRYEADFQKPTFAYPKNFDFLTEADYIQQIKDMMDAGLPAQFITAVLEKYIDRLFSTNADKNAVFRLAIATDRFFTLTEAQMAVKLGNRVADGWEDILHSSSIFIIRDLMEDNPEFLEQDFKTQKDQVIAAAQEKEASLGTTNQPNQPLIDT